MSQADNQDSSSLKKDKKIKRIISRAGTEDFSFFKKIKR